MWRNIVFVVRSYFVPREFSFLKRVTLVQNSGLTANGQLTVVGEAIRLTAKESQEESGSFNNVTPPVFRGVLKRFWTTEARREEDRERRWAGSTSEAHWR